MGARGLSCAAFLGMLEGIGLEVEQLGIKPVPVWDGATGTVPHSACPFEYRSLKTLL